MNKLEICVHVFDLQIPKPEISIIIYHFQFIKYTMHVFQ